MGEMFKNFCMFEMKLRKSNGGLKNVRAHIFMKHLNWSHFLRLFLSVFFLISPLIKYHACIRFSLSLAHLNAGHSVSFWNDKRKEKGHSIQFYNGCLMVHEPIPSLNMRTLHFLKSIWTKTTIRTNNLHRRSLIYFCVDRMKSTELRCSHCELYKQK